MNTDRKQPRLRTLLRWYPRQWRDRYGDELVAMMQDDLAGDAPSVRFRLAIALAGLRERGHDTGLLGDSRSAVERSRAGSLLVLCSWAAFMVAGASFSKLSEHFQQSVAPRMQALSVGSYDVVFVLGILGGLLVLGGATITLPAFVRFLRSGGWPSVRRHFVRAAVATLCAVAALAATRSFAHGLTTAQRNGVDATYSLVFIATALLVAAALGLWTAVAVASVRRMVLSAAVLRVEATLATAVGAAMLVMTVATTLWWWAVASAAPSFLSGSRLDVSSWQDSNIVTTAAGMLVATAFASYGVMRVALSRRYLDQGLAGFAESPTGSRLAGPGPVPYTDTPIPPPLRRPVPPG